MDAFQEETFRTKLQSATFRLLIALAIAAPLIVSGFHAYRYVSQYMEASWYSKLGDWYSSQVTELRRQAAKYEKWAKTAPSTSEQLVWNEKAKKMISEAEQYAEKASQARERGREWTRFW